MKNKKTDNSRCGYPYAKNRKSNILIIGITVHLTQKERDSMNNATLNQLSSIVGVEHRDYYRLFGYCSDDALALRWRRLISPCSAVTINCAVLCFHLLLSILL
ncbi:hypothetical protein KKI90_15745 [Xenorhabdus bovienii]|nr:hypothetical protein [Xenorhabdus bovienii]MDE9478649.1 hypothetical protein [Xenorhabdus bovienii]